MAATRVVYHSGSLPSSYLCHRHSKARADDTQRPKGGKPRTWVAVRVNLGR